MFLNRLSLPSCDINKIQQLLVSLSIVDMEYGHQEQEWNLDAELELGSDVEYETLESHERIGSHDKASGSPDDRKSFAVPDVSADISKGKAAKQQLGKEQILLHVCHL